QAGVNKTFKRADGTEVPVPDLFEHLNPLQADGHDGGLPRTALQGGKDIHEAVLYMEKQEQLWKMTLKGTTFHFASFKAPPVTLEKDDITDPDMEREAVFFERMYLLEEGLQLFDSLLSTFLRQRLDANWIQKEQAIRTYLAAA
ncbi:MAG: hypothetical protein JJE15_15540, partial [Desulfobacteraceae bacterium]|nr:hypothetical protein [Desulfobacteraceae bacterium]